MKQVGPKMPSGMANPMEALQIPQEEMIQLPPQPDRKYQIIWPIRKRYDFCLCVCVSLVLVGLDRRMMVDLRLSCDGIAHYLTSSLISHKVIFLSL